MMYIYVANTLASKRSKMPPNAISEHLFFKIFWEGHAPDSYHWQAMYAQLIVLCAITSYSQSNVHFICVTIPDLENPLENRLWARCILNSYAYISLIVHPSFGIPESAPAH